MAECGHQPPDLGDTCIREAGHEGTHLGARGTAWWDHTAEQVKLPAAEGIPSMLGDVLYSTDPLQERQVGVAVHGDTPYDVAYISQVQGNLWQGGVDPSLVLPENIEHVVSLFPTWQYQLDHQPQTYTLLWWQDAGLPSLPLLHHTAAWVHGLTQLGPTLVHCQAGLNRSSLLVVATLMYGGMPAHEAILLVRKRSPACLCNQAFQAYLLSPECAAVFA